jgi:hypothetical protein
VSSVAVRERPLPALVTAEATARGTAYSWPVLPNSPGLIVFFVVLAAPLVLLGPFLLLADVLDRVGLAESVFEGAAGVWPYGAIFSIFTLATGRFFATALLGRCRLTLSHEEMDYEVFVLGRRLRRDSRRLPAASVAGIVLKEASKGGLEVQRADGKPFYLKLPVGTGGLSTPDLLALKERWLRDLGRA